MNEQQKYFAMLSKHTFPEHLKVAVNHYSSDTKEYQPGKRVNAEQYEQHDERTVAVNEIVWDLDWPSYKANCNEAKKIVEALDFLSMPYWICATGGKGIHIHTFFNRIEFEDDKQKKLWRDATSYGYNYKNVRFWIWNKVLDHAGIDERYRQKQVDKKPLLFNYSTGSTRLIRSIGGRKYIKNTEGDWNATYKTLIEEKALKSKKNTILHQSGVIYPKDVPTFNINPVEFSGELQEYVVAAEKRKENKLRNIKFSGKYLEIDGILKIRDGMSEGQRSAGASAISIACALDKLTKTDATVVLDEYVNNCTQMGSRFTLPEAKGWLNWVYNHERPFWNCQMLKDLDVHETSTCQHCQTRNKESIKLLEHSGLMKEIQEVLDNEIVGESRTKMLIFLLLLSKDFPSKTGRPGWNIKGDPMSQNIILSSDSSSGKSYIAKRILELMGEEGEDYFVFSRITQNALNYYTEINMDGKIIMIEEMQGLDQNTSQLRIWMSEGKLDLNSVEEYKDEEGNKKLKNNTKTTMGQPSFITSQAEGVIENQLNNRTWVLSTDISRKQTKEILGYQDDIAMGDYISTKEKVRQIKEALKLLKQYHFIVPYADHEILNIPLDDVRSRRDYMKFLSLIMCSAYLHQKQRLIHTDEAGNEFIVCDFQDYDIAREYSQEILGATFSGLTNTQIDLLQFVINMEWKEPFTIPDIMRTLNKSQSHWWGMCRQMVDLGFFTEEKVGGGATKFDLVQTKLLNIVNLPSSQEIFESLKTKFGAIAAISGNDTSGQKNGISQENRKSQFFAKFSPYLEKSLIAAIAPGSSKSDVTPVNKENSEKSQLLKNDLRSTGVFSTSQNHLLRTSLQGGKNNSCDLGLKRVDMTQYLSKNQKHKVPYEDIQKYFKSYTEEQINECLKKLKSEGTIIEIQGKIMLL